MTYREARVYLDEMSKYGSVLGLDTIRGLLRELGNPQDDLKFIHIAGTNGKGSVLAYTSTILSEAGYRVGRYVSPTVVSYLERIQTDGEWIPEEKFAQLTEKVRDAIARMEAAGEHSPTVFEAETAIAFLYFREMKCDLVVLEAGLGGELDATNIVSNTICAVFTSIGRDHIGVIGDTVEEIAQNKAGIIKPGCTVVSVRQRESVNEVIKSRAEACGCSYVQADPRRAEILEESHRGTRFAYSGWKNGGECRDRGEKFHTVLAGRNQIENAVTALEVIRALQERGYAVSTEAVKRGMERTVWPGRFTCLGENPVFILDGAHNEDAALKLKESVETYFHGRRLVYITGVFRDKEYRRIARIMGPAADTVFTVDLPDRNRGLPASELAEVYRDYCGDVRAPEREMPGNEASETVERAVRAAIQEAAEEDVVLVFGSLSFLSQAEAAYRAVKDEEG